MREPAIRSGGRAPAPPMKIPHAIALKTTAFLQFLCNRHIALQDYVSDDTLTDRYSLLQPVTACLQLFLQVFIGLLANRNYLLFINSN